MAEAREQDARRRTPRQFVERLAENRWAIAAGVTAVAAVHLFANGSNLFVFAAMVAMAAAMALAPRLTRRQRRAEQAAEAERAALAGLTAENLAAAVTDPLFIFDPSGMVVHANGAARASFGGVGSGMSLMLRFRAPEIQRAIERVGAGEVASEVVEYVERVPIERVYRVTASAIGGGTDLFVAVFEDQSETRRIDRMRADFIANASHELRTPLATISGFVETLRGPARDDAAARDRFLTIMQNQTQRMARLIDDLLSLSRLEVKPYLPPATLIDIREVVVAVIDSLKPLARESNVAIETLFGEAPVRARGDRDELFQVFENLLENACKYGQAGGRVTVAIEAVDLPEPEATVTITDFGPGIPAEHIPRVTERFYRVDVATSRAQKGTGLGLAIVKHILTRHNARLSIKSEVGKGSAFTVHLPR